MKEETERRVWRKVSESGNLRERGFDGEQEKTLKVRYQSGESDGKQEKPVNEANGAESLTEGKRKQESERPEQRV